MWEDMTVNPLSVSPVEDAEEVEEGAERESEEE